MPVRNVRADNVQKGDALPRGPGQPPYCVVEVGSNSLGDVVLRCSFGDPQAYPGTSLMLPPDELVEVEG